MFTADAPVSVAAGGIIPFRPQIANCECFEICSGCVRIKKSGGYHVVWTLNVPSYQNLCSRIYLTLNGREIPGSAQTVCCQADNTSTSVTGQAMITVPPNAVICLVSESALCLEGGCNVENVATLSIQKMEQ